MLLFYIESIHDNYFYTNGARFYLLLRTTEKYNFIDLYVSIFLKVLKLLAFYLHSIVQRLYKVSPGILKNTS